jgi:hypothetical protein
MTDPLLYEINTRQWLFALSAREGRPIDLSSVPDAELDGWQRRGFTHIWLMGVWPTGPKSRGEAVRHPDCRRGYDEALPGWTENDVLGSPYAVADTHVAPTLGGDNGLAAFRRRLKARGLSLILDFVPNHLALDHPWVEARPDLFVQKDGKIAHGKDPYFDPWTDTVQLDYRRPATRAAMTDMLKGISARCDGVRCDMAMLVLNDVFAKTWGGPNPATTEFWADAISAVKKDSPRFIFLAEAYWDLEERLQGLGFDYTYDKKLYDLLVHRNYGDVQGYLAWRGLPYIRRSAHFLENHDEPRAATRLGLPEHRAAALLSLGLPGLRFLHEGQLEGVRRFSRIQLSRRADEPLDDAIAALYEDLLSALKHTSVGRGEPTLIPPGQAWPDNPTHRNHVLVQWQAPGARSFDLVVVNLAPHRSQCRVRLTARGLEGKLFSMSDSLGTDRFERRGDDLRAENGLFLDLPEHGAQLFRFERVYRG